MKNTRPKAIFGSSILMLLVALIVTLPAKAQEMDAAAIKKSTPQQRANWQNKMMKEDLKLSGAQYQQVSKLNLEYAQKMQPLFNSDENRFSKGLKARSIMKEKDGKLKVILSEEQYDSYQKIVKEKTAAVREAIMGD